MRYIICISSYDNYDPIGVVQGKDKAEEFVEKYNSFIESHPYFGAERVYAIEAGDDLSIEDELNRLEQEYREHIDYMTQENLLQYNQPPKPPWWEIAPKEIKELLP